MLVNSAGIVQDGLLGAMTDEQWRDVSTRTSAARSTTATP